MGSLLYGLIRALVRPYAVFKSEAGAILVMTAASMVVLAGFAAIAIDGGRLYVTRGDIQNSADAAALAGVQSLHLSDAEAEDRAREWAEKNGLEEDEVESVDIDQNCSGGLKSNTVTVHVTRNVEFTLAQVLGITDSDVVACATAQIGSPAEINGLIPVAPTDEVVKYDGTPTVMKMDAPPTNGNTQAIRLDGPGASEYEDNWLNGADQYVCASEADPDSSVCQASSLIDTQPGNIRGKTERSVEWRIDNTKAECDTPEEVFIPRDDGKYGIKAGCNPFQGDTGSYRVVLVPIIDELCNGSCTVQILRFAVFWLNGFGPEGCANGNTCEVLGTWYDVVADLGGKLGALESTESIVTPRLID